MSNRRSCSIAVRKRSQRKRDGLTVKHIYDLAGVKEQAEERE
jgi:hypothetical protein